MLQYTTVGLLYTRTCPLACRHCIIESSPKAEGKMRQETAAEYVRTITAYSKEVCFTGGEPLLYYTEVVELIRFAVSLGLETSVVSGAGWVRVDKTEIARERVRGLKEAGLKKLCISWDQYHEEFSPRAQAELLASLAQEFEIEVVVRGVVPANRRDARPKTVFGRAAARSVQHGADPLDRAGWKRVCVLRAGAVREDRIAAVAWEHRRGKSRGDSGARPARSDPEGYFAGGAVWAVSAAEEDRPV
jgi:hypothetical protein